MIIAAFLIFLQKGPPLAGFTSSHLQQSLTRSSSLLIAKFRTFLLEKGPKLQRAAFSLKGSFISLQALGVPCMESLFPPFYSISSFFSAELYWNILDSPTLPHTLVKIHQFLLSFIWSSTFHNVPRTMKFCLSNWFPSKFLRSSMREIWKGIFWGKRPWSRAPARLGLKLQFWPFPEENPRCALFLICCVLSCLLTKGSLFLQVLLLSCCEMQSCLSLPR